MDDDSLGHDILLLFSVSVFGFRFSHIDDGFVLLYYLSGLFWLLLYGLSMGWMDGCMGGGF